MMRTCLKTMLLLAGSSALLIASETTNLISNGTFESGDITGWTLDVKKDSGAVATRMLDSTSGTAKGGKVFHRTVVTGAPSDPASNNWHIQLKDPSYTVKAVVFKHDNDRCIVFCIC